MRKCAGNRAVVEYTAGASERLRRGRLGSLLFPADVKARRDKMVGLVETMRVTADGLQLTAYGL